MKKKILRYLRHIFGTLVILLVIGIFVLVSLNGSLEYGNNPLSLNLDKEGPYVFYENDTILIVNYIRGNKIDGFYLDKKEYHSDSEIPAVVISH